MWFASLHARAPGYQLVVDRVALSEERAPQRELAACIALLQQRSSSGSCDVIVSCAHVERWQMGGGGRRERGRVHNVQDRMMTRVGPS